MNLAELSKEQQRYAILGVGLVAALLGFGVSLSKGLAGLSEAKSERDANGQKVDVARRTLARRGRVRREFIDVARRLAEDMPKIPPGRQYYSWVSEIVYALGRDSGLVINAIDEKRVSKVPAKSPKPGKEDAIALGTYALQIDAKGGYGELKRFLWEMEKKHPFVQVTTLSIQAGSLPDEHAVRIVIRWPLLSNGLFDEWVKRANLKMSELGGESAPAASSAKKPKATVRAGASDAIEPDGGRKPAMQTEVQSNAPAASESNAKEIEGVLDVLQSESDLPTNIKTRRRTGRWDD